MEKTTLNKVEYTGDIENLNLYDYFEKDGQLFYVYAKYEGLRPAFSVLTEELKDKYIWQ